MNLYSPSKCQKSQKQNKEKKENFVLLVIFKLKIKL
jgi:hypothetical protein